MCIFIYRYQDYEEEKEKKMQIIPRLVVEKRKNVQFFFFFFFFFYLTQYMKMIRFVMLKMVNGFLSKIYDDVKKKNFFHQNETKKQQHQE